MLTNTELRDKYRLLYFLNSLSLEVFNNGVTNWANSIKKELRKDRDEKENNNVRNICWSLDRCIDLITFPEEVKNEEDAEEYFDVWYYRESPHSLYDCTGKWFTSRHKIFERNGKWMCYHVMLCDI